jgi:hydrogenase maturation protein HypF
MALSYLTSYPTGSPAGPVDAAEDAQKDLDDLGIRLRRPERWEQVTAMVRAGVNAPPTSSAGRLFDAVAAILDLRDTVTYEGQAAIELERRADQSERGRYPVALRTPEAGGPFQVVGADLLRAVLADRRAGAATEVIAARFHNAVASMIVDGCVRVREQTGLTAVALSGGVFQNRLLVERTVPALESHGFTVLTHRNVPPNDGGISLGQAAVAAARDQPHSADLDVGGV